MEKNNKPKDYKGATMVVKSRDNSLWLKNVENIQKYKEVNLRILADFG